MWFNTAKNNITISISGWRTIFSAPHDPLKLTIDAHTLTAMYYGIISYIEAKKSSIRNNSSTDNLTIVLGCDSRPSGAILLYLAEKILHDLQVQTTILDIIPAPAIMAYTKEYADGFIYFSASHNPLEYNGIKFGNHLGEVQNSTDHNKMLEVFNRYATSNTDIPDLTNKVLATASTILSEKPYIINKNAYHIAIATYQDKVLQAVFRGLDNPKEAFKTQLDNYLIQHNKTKIGILWDPNGGARAWDNDVFLLEQLGIHSKAINAEYGIFKHAILPEGVALDQANSMLQQLQKEDQSILWLCAIVCDCDGDRGNTIFTIYKDTKGNTTKALNPQEVFTMTLQTELAWEQYIQSLTSTTRPIGVVINGPSSLRCNTLAKQYKALITRSEVGEANVVNLGKQLRNKGYSIPMVGEASNGGIIIHPSTVRDPLCTVLSVLKNILWADILNLSSHVTDTITQLPLGSTTATEDPLAKFSLPDIPYNIIARMLQEQFGKCFEHVKNLFMSHTIEIVDYRFINFTGTHTYVIPKDNIHTNIEKGGLAIHFYNSVYTEDATPIAFVWLRPSGTEPIVRIMADVLGEQAVAIERSLIQVWRDYLQSVLY